MSIYSQLLLSTGGGIVSNTSKADQSGGATVAIGLGGTGIDCLKLLKKEVYTRIKPDNYDPKKEGDYDISFVPKYGHIKFLAIDTDITSIKPETKKNDKNEETVDDYACIADNEFEDISCNNIRSVIYAHDNLNLRNDMQWLSHQEVDGKLPLSIKDTSYGAGGIRQVGRFLALEKANVIVNRLTSVISSVRENSKKGLNIHIFSGIGGGTGSGTFLDICYLLRRVLSNEALEGAVTVCGYFFLPDVNMSKPYVKTNNELRRQIQRNGFAALKELDYCMNFESNGDCWDQYYGNSRFSTQLPPVDLCHLVSAQTESGFIPSDPYNYAMNVVCDYVLEFTADQGGGFGLDSHMANVKGHLLDINLNARNGANYQYAALGASNAIVPYREITTYLATHLFERFGSIYENTPNDGDAKIFADSVKLNYDVLFREFVKKADPDGFVGRANSFDKRTLRSNMSPLINDFNNYFDDIAGKQAENASAMKASLDKDYNQKQDGENAISIINRIFYELYQTCICNPKWGPFFSKNLLTSVQSRDLIDIVKGLETTNREKLDHCSNWASKHHQTMENAKAAWSSRQNRKNTEAYINAMLDYYTMQAKADAYGRFGKVLDKLKTQIDELATNYFLPLCTTLNNLKETFSENLSSINLMFSNGTESTSYLKPIMELSSLKGSMDEQLEAINVDNAINKLITQLVLNPKAWIAGDPNKISSFIIRFMNQDVFSEFANRTILSYLKIKFNTTNDLKITESLKETTIKELASDADPLLWKTSGYNLDNTSTIQYLSVPYNINVVVDAAQGYADQAGDLMVRKSNISDRISFLRFYCGVPLFAYQGLSVYEEVYATNPFPGTHLYERGAIDKQWDIYLPAPIPMSFQITGRNIPNEVLKYQNAAKQVLDDCIKTGIAKNENASIVIRKYDFSEINDYFDQIKISVSKGRNSEAESSFEEMAEKFSTLNFTVLESKSISGSNNANHIAPDRFVSSPKIRDFAVSALDAYREAEKIVNAAQGYLPDTESFELFKDSLFIGLIKYKPLFDVKLIVKDENGLLLEEEVLCNSQMKSKKVPYYQAYLTFQELSADIKKNVKSVRDKYFEFSDDGLNALIKENMSELAVDFEDAEYISDLQTDAKTLESPGEVISFLSDLVREYKSFARMVKRIR